MKEARWKHRMEGLQEGELKGLREGELKGRLEIARKMLQQGMPIEQIKSLTKLTDEQLDKLKH